MTSTTIGITAQGLFEEGKLEDLSKLKNVPLIIGRKERFQIKQLIGRAEGRPVPYDRMLAYATGTRPLPVNFNADYTIPIPRFYKVTYTHEEHAPGVVCRHMSISCANRDRVPNQYAVAWLMELFGFVNKMFWPDRGVQFKLLTNDEADAKAGRIVKVWIEDLKSGGKAINVLEPLDGDWARLEEQGV
jgi:hypothetical protein